MPNVSLEDFKKQLTNHDWYYSMSDDRRIYDRGRREHDRLKGIAQNGSDDLKRAYNEEHKKYFDRPGIFSDWNPPFKF